MVVLGDQDECLRAVLRHGERGLFEQFLVSQQDDIGLGELRGIRGRGGLLPRLGVGPSAFASIERSPARVTGVGATTNARVGVTRRAPEPSGPRPRPRSYRRASDGRIWPPGAGDVVEQGFHVAGRPAVHAEQHVAYDEAGLLGGTTRIEEATMRPASGISGSVAWKGSRPARSRRPAGAAAVARPRATRSRRCSGSRARDGRAIMAFIPTTSPLALRSGPPELPGAERRRTGRNASRPRTARPPMPLTTPAVTAPSRPHGWPMADEPRRAERPSPRREAGRSGALHAQQREVEVLPLFTTPASSPGRRSGPPQPSRRGLCQRRRGSS